jgi:hypothetical protein
MDFSITFFIRMMDASPEVIFCEFCSGGIQIKAFFFGMVDSN